MSAALAGRDAGHREHAVHAPARVRAGRVPLVLPDGPVRHVLLEHLHVHHRLLRVLRARVRPSPHILPAPSCRCWGCLGVQPAVHAVILVGWTEP